MKPVFKAILIIFIPPILAVGALKVYVSMSEKAVNTAFTPPEELVWNISGTNHTVRISDSRSGDLQTLSIDVVGANDEVFYSTEYEIDWDLYGVGFVKGLQVDADPEVELVMVQRRRPNENWYLDPVDGAVVERPFDGASPEAKAIVERWLDFNFQAIMTAGLVLLASLAWLLGAVGYYVVVVPILRFVKRRKLANTNR